MSTPYRQTVRAEREAICAYLDGRGMRWIADRIRNGEHLKPMAAAGDVFSRPRGMEEPRDWEDGA